MPSVSDMLANLNNGLDNYQYEPAEETAGESLISRVDVATEPPEELSSPGGMLSSFANYAQSLATNHIPVIAPIMAGLVMLGTLVGQKFMTETGLRTNLFCFVLAPSGLGKNAPLEAIRNVCYESGCLDLIGPNHVASSQTLFPVLKKNPSLAMLVDEVGDLFASMRRTGGDNQKSELLSLFKEVYSATNTIWTKKYANVDSDIVIPFPHLSLYCTGVPGPFWGSLHSGDIGDGFIPRTLIIDMEAKIVRNGGNHSALPPEELTRPVRFLSKLEPAYAGDLKLTPLPKVIKQSAEAKAMFLEWDNNLVAMQNSCLGSADGRDSIYARTAEKVQKIALIHAISLACGRVPEHIGVESIDYAIKLVDWINGHMIDKLRDNITDNKIGAVQNKIMKVIRQKSVASSADLCNSLRNTRKWEMDEAIEMLLRANKINQTFNGKWMENKDA